MGALMKHIEKRGVLNYSHLMWLGLAALLVTIPLLSLGWASRLASLPSPQADSSQKIEAHHDQEIESDVVIVMRDRAFHIIRGGINDHEQPFFQMQSGLDHMITIRNEDDVVHDFMSPLFDHIDVHFSGDATMVFAEEAAGFRIEPGQSATIRFSPPQLPDNKQEVEELFWCNIHEHTPQDKKGKGQEHILARIVRESSEREREQ